MCGCVCVCVCVWVDERKRETRGGEIGDEERAEQEEKSCASLKNETAVLSSTK